MSCRPRGVLSSHLTSLPAFGDDGNGSDGGPHHLDHLHHLPASALHRAYAYHRPYLHNGTANSSNNDEEESLRMLDDDAPYAGMRSAAPRLPAQEVCSRVALGTLLVCCCLVTAGVTLVVVAALLQLPHDIVVATTTTSSWVAPAAPPAPPPSAELDQQQQRRRSSLSRHPSQRSLLRRLAMLTHAVPPKHGADMKAVARVSPRWVEGPPHAPAWRVDDALADMALALSHLARAEQGGDDRLQSAR